MQTIKIHTRIAPKGCIQLPREYRYTYGQKAKMVLQVSNENEHQFYRRMPGSARGILKIHMEDDEHLNDFNEYMK